MMTSIHFPHPLPFETPHTHTQLCLFLYDTQTVKVAKGQEKLPQILVNFDTAKEQTHTAQVSSLSTVRVVLDE